MDELWPELPLEAWKNTYSTLHMWTQVVGKVRMKLSPAVNHWWHSALYVTSRGLTTSPIPYGPFSFEISFDFIDHFLSIQTTSGQSRYMGLCPKSVSTFYHELMDHLGSLGIQAKIDVIPSEVPNPIAFDQDTAHSSYDRTYAHRFWQILVQSDRILKELRGEFIGKSSPVHFFWGSFDLAMSRFSGRTAPERPGADHITQLGYSHELVSFGFWPGGGSVKGPAYYAYAAPEPAGFSEGSIRPSSAAYNPATHGYVLMYDEVRKSKNPEQLICDFFQSVYQRAAQLGKWDPNLLAATRKKGLRAAS